MSGLEISDNVLDELLDTVDATKPDEDLGAQLVQVLKARAAARQVASAGAGQKLPSAQRKYALHSKTQERLESRVLRMFSEGYNARQIRSQLSDMLGVNLSPHQISRILDSTSDEQKKWLSRPLDAIYPVLYLDCIYVKIRDGSPRPKAVYVAFAITMEGLKEVVGIWIAPTEGAKFWRHALTELRNRGVQDFLVVCVDGLAGFSEAIASVYPRSAVQRCVVHMVRASLAYVPARRRQEVAADLKGIYSAATLALAETRLDDFDRKWNHLYVHIVQMWRKAWPDVSTFFDFPPDIRKVLYTTNLIESLNSSIRRVTAYKHFPNDDYLLRLLFLTMRSISQKWSNPIRQWRTASMHFSIMFEERLS